MRTAVERLEIWTAFALLLVASFVGAAGTMAWIAETPERVVRPRLEQPSPAQQLMAQTASSAARIAAGVAEYATSTGRRAVQLLGELPGGTLGAVAAAIVGTAALPLVAAAGRGVRATARGTCKRFLPLRRHLSLPVRRVRAHRRAAGGAVTAPTLLAGETEPAGGEMGLVSGIKPGAGETCMPGALLAPAEHATPPELLPAGVGDQQPRSPACCVEAAELPANDASGMGEHAGREGQEDRAFAALQAAQTVLVACGARSPVLAVDIAGDQAQVLLDLLPEDGPRLERAFAARAIDSTTARLQWRPPALQLRFVGAAAAETTTLAVPLLALGRRATRYIPLAGWRHLGIYGAGAHAAAHHLIATLLCRRRPDELALAVLDRQGWASLYRNTPHWVDAPGDGPATADALARALRRGGSVALRPLLLVLVDPDGATLAAFVSLHSRLSLQPAAPVHIVLVQQRLHPLGRQLYLGLPALVTGGAAVPELLPAVRQWPRRGSAVVLVGGQRWTGRAFESDEASAGELARRLARYAHSAVPVLWQYGDVPVAVPARTEPLLDTSAAIGSNGS